MGKFDFIGLSLSNPQSGQSLFLLQDSNSPYLSLSLSLLRFIQGVSLVYPIKIFHDRYLTTGIWKIFEDGFEGKLLRFFSYKMSPTGDISHKISIFVKNVISRMPPFVFFHGLNFELFDNLSVDITETLCIYRKRNCAVTPFSFRKSRRIERDIEKVAVNSPKIDRWSFARWAATLFGKACRSRSGSTMTDHISLSSPSLEDRIAIISMNSRILFPLFA